MGELRRVAMALYGDVTYDSRVRREAGTLARAGYEVTIVCLAGAGASDIPDSVRIKIQRPPDLAVIPGSANPFFGARGGRLTATLRRITWLIAYVRGLQTWGRLAIEAAGPVDLWHVHDLTGLAAISPNLDRDTPIVYDSHELFLETGTALRLPPPARWVLERYERRLMSRAAAVITVNEALAETLRGRYRGPVYAVHNCPDRWQPATGRPANLRDATGVGSSTHLILYHGAISINRGIEQLMDAMLEPGLRDAHLALMGSGEMRDPFMRAAAEARFGNRVHVLVPVPPHELLTWVASADVGAMPLQPTTRNLRLSTPNKLFECLAAGVPVVVSSFPAMREIVINNPGGRLGAECDPLSAASIADAIRSILDLERAEMAELRLRCRRAAEERWNWQHEERILLSAYDSIQTRQPVSRVQAQT